MTTLSLIENPEPIPDSAISVDAETDDAFLGVFIDGGPVVQDRLLATVADTEVTPGRHRTVYGIGRQMRAAGSPVDQLLLVGWVDRHALLEFGPQRDRLAVWLAEITSKAPAPASASYYACLVVEKAARQRVKAAGTRLIEIASAGRLADLKQVVRSESSAAVTAVVRAERVIG